MSVQQFDMYCICYTGYLNNVKDIFHNFPTSFSQLKSPKTNQKKSIINQINQQLANKITC